MVPSPTPSTKRTRRHRQLLASVSLRYRTILVHDDDIERLRRYAARLLRARQQEQQA